MFDKEKMGVLAAEFFGTALLASTVLVSGHMFGLGTAAWYVSITAGATLALIVCMFGGVSGAHVNPAVTVGLWTLKKIDSMTAAMYVAAQVLGGVAALSLYNYLTADSVAALATGGFQWTAFWAEMIGAAIFGSGIAAVVYQKLEGYYAAFMIGASLTLGALFASVASAGFLNPAVALGNNAWSKVLAVAPVVGMVVGMNLYASLFAPAAKKASRKKK